MQMVVVKRVCASEKESEKRKRVREKRDEGARQSVALRNK